MMTPLDQVIYLIGLLLLTAMVVVPWAYGALYLAGLLP